MASLIEMKTNGSFRHMPYFNINSKLDAYSVTKEFAT